MTVLCRMRLSRAPTAQALKALLDPPEAGARMDAQHRLLWSAFGDRPDRARDFLFRDMGHGDFAVLASRPPQATELFEPPEVTPFAPDLRAGDRLSFVLRANATRSLPSGPGRRGVRVDVVMERLHGVSEAERADRRMDIAQEAGADWLARQGARAGFAPVRTDVASYDAVTLPGHRGRRKGAPRLGLLEMTGVLEVTDPAAFVPAVVAGFGRAKAFGNGLMLLRRA